MATLDEQFAAAKAQLDSQISDAKAGLELQKSDTLKMVQESHDVAQNSINSQSSALSSQALNLGQFQLDHPLQPIVVQGPTGIDPKLVIALGAIFFIFIRRH